MITIKNLSKSFGDKSVLTHFNAFFRKGNITAIMGESGCGKTTLINIIMGLESADSGEILGVPDKISAVFQEDCLCDDFSAISNLRAVTGRSLSKSNAASLLFRFGLTKNDVSCPVKQLSGGMKRRVAIARALVAEGELVIMDEPFKGLDEDTRAKSVEIVETEIRRLKKTLILITHDPWVTELIHAEEVIKM